MSEAGQTSTSGCYEIRIWEALDERWLSWFSGLEISCEAGGNEAPLTVLAVRVPDQAKLRGILNKIWDMGLSVHSMIRREEPFYPSEDHHD